MNSKTVVLVDGSYYLRHTMSMFGSLRPEDAVKALRKVAENHLTANESLLRIFFYDCEPLNREIIHPISGERFNPADTASAKWRMSFFAELRRNRKMTLRLGQHQFCDEWKLNREPLAKMLANKSIGQALAPEDVSYSSRQKGVDLLVGIDATKIALKHMAGRIVLIAGDGDFVPAVRMAQEEGLEVILDAMGSKASQSLMEAVDDCVNTPADLLVAKDDPVWSASREAHNKGISPKQIANAPRSNGEAFSDGGSF